MNILLKLFVVLKLVLWTRKFDEAFLVEQILYI